MNSHPCERCQPNVVFGQLVTQLDAGSSSGGFTEEQTLNPLPADFLPVFLQFETYIAAY